MNVLVVDDTEDVRVLLRHTLHFSRIEVTEAEGGNAALTRLRTESLPDVVLLDVQMPDVDGWETLRRIRSDPRTADLRVVMCTVKSRGPDIVRGWELGCDGYVMKPFDFVKLAAELKRVLAMSAEERADARTKSLAAARALV